jgi:hypothetical protein
MFAKKTTNYGLALQVPLSGPAVLPNVNPRKPQTGRRHRSNALPTVLVLCRLVEAISI